MGQFKKECDNLFVEEMTEYANSNTLLDGSKVVINNGDIYLGSKKLYCGTKSIIDDVLIWCSNIACILVYFECVCKVFRKFRVSFRQDKCHFLLDRVEYVGHDLLSNGNCPAKSKFNMIEDWSLPTTGTGLHSFVGLVMFYHRYAPYLEMRIKPLRVLIKKYFRSDIPLMAWTPTLITLFHDIKVSITSSPVLARYDPSKPTFLKTDWSAEGMGWILMQPADDEESIKATKLLRETGECLFDLTRGGARLRPTGFGSRCCVPKEKKYHSFVGEAACGRWAISQNRRFLWGTHFYWMCDCKAIKEILDYNGPIAMMCRWAQELLGYHFSILHRSARMMIDVDGLSRRFGAIIAQHLCVAALLYKYDVMKRPDAYNQDLSEVDGATSITPSKASSNIDIPVLTTKTIAACRTSVITINDRALVVIPTTHPSSSQDTIHSVPILLHYIPDHTHSSTTLDEEETARPLLRIAQNSICTWVCIDDVLGSFLSWSKYSSSGSVEWNIINVFTSRLILNYYI